MLFFKCLLGVYLIVEIAIIIVSVIFLARDNNANLYLIFMPQIIYSMESLNIVGKILLSIMGFIMLPLHYIVAFFYFICVKRVHYKDNLNKVLYDENILPWRKK